MKFISNALFLMIIIIMSFDIINSSLNNYLTNNNDEIRTDCKFVCSNGSSITYI